MLSLRKTKTATRHGDWGGVNMGGGGLGWLGVYEGVFGVSGGVLDMGGRDVVWVQGEAVWGIGRILGIGGYAFKYEWHSAKLSYS